MKKELLTATDTWVRGLYMALFIFVFWLAKLVGYGVALIQFLILLATGQPNVRLTEFGKRLSVYIYQLMLFLTFASDEKPFPFSDWPRYVALETNEKPSATKTDDTPPP